MDRQVPRISNSRSQAFQELRCGMAALTLSRSGVFKSTSNEKSDSKLCSRNAPCSASLVPRHGRGYYRLTQMVLGWPGVGFRPGGTSLQFMVGSRCQQLIACRKPSAFRQSAIHPNQLWMWPGANLGFQILALDRPHHVNGLPLRFIVRTREELGDQSQTDELDPCQDEDGGREQQRSIL